MIHKQDNLVQYTQYTKVALTLRPVFDTLSHVFEDELDFIDIFYSKSNYEQQSKIFDDFLEKSFGTDKIVCLIDYHNAIKVPKIVSSQRTLHESVGISLDYEINIYIASLFKNKKDFYVYKLSNPKYYNNIFTRFFDDMN